MQFLHTPEGFSSPGVCGRGSSPIVRCLTPVQQRIEFELEEEFIATVEVLTGAPIAVDPDETRRC
ncbi:MAG: hypothetical protein HZY76_17575 [Anaerolineae bacterium]|nr:MAG: hypothetical protein HZY76_17575 [Anaerolineae bacterium]